MAQAPAKKPEDDHQKQVTDNPYTRGIAQFASGLTYGKIPPEVRHRIKLLLLDTFGVGIYGSIIEHSKRMVDAITKIDSSTQCTIWGTDKRVSAPDAALINGTFIQGFEIDDLHRHGGIHVGATTVPAITAIAEIRPGMSGERFMTAAVAGYEIGPRVGQCMGAEAQEQGWHAGAINGVFGGAASSASALGLSEEQTIDALGTAGTQAGGLMAAQYGAMCKRMTHGRAAQSGLYGAILAEAGFTGIKNVFESEFGGFCTTFSRSTDRFKMAELTRDLGERWETMRDTVKFYSAAGSNHTTLDAVRTMRERHPFTPDQVERVVVHGAQNTKDHVFWKYEPTGVTAAQMCLPYVVATMLLDGDFFVDQVREDMLADPERIALSRKVDFIGDPSPISHVQRYWVRVEIFLKDGTRLEESVKAQRGSEEKFATDEDIVSKYEKLLKHVLPAQQVAAIRDCVLGLDKLDDTSKLIKLLALK